MSYNQSFNGVRQYKPARSTYNGVRSMDAGIPRTGLIFYAKAPGMTDVIGESASDLLAALPDEHKSIYFADVGDAGTKYDDATIITNIEASVFLNDGGELVGRKAKGYAQYAAGTSAQVLAAAYNYFRSSYLLSELFNGLDTSGTLTGGGGVVADATGRLRNITAASPAWVDGRYAENLLKLDNSGWVAAAGSPTITAVGDGVSRFEFSATYDAIKNGSTAIPVSYYENVFFAFDAKSEDTEGDIRVVLYPGSVRFRPHLTTEWQRFYYYSAVPSGYNGSPIFTKYEDYGNTPNLESFLIRNPVLFHFGDDDTLINFPAIIGEQSTQKKCFIDNEYYCNRGISAWGDSLTASYPSVHVSYPEQLQQRLARTVFNGGVGSTTSTQIRDNFLSHPEKYNDIHIICSGRNNLLYPETILADTAAMVAAMGHSDYIILGPRNRDGEGIGTDEYDAIMQLNSSYSSIYADRYVDIYQLLMDNYDPLNAIDVAWRALGICPISLTSDGDTGGPHPNSKANRLITDAILAKFTSLGFDTSLLSRGIYSEKTIILNSGITRTAHQIPESQSKGMLIEPASANKIQGYKGNAISDTSTLKSGNTSGVVSIVVEDTSFIESAIDRDGNTVNLMDAVNQKKVFDIDNTLGGTGDKYLEFVVSPANSNYHSARAFIRRVSGASDIRLGFSNTKGSEIGVANTNQYVEIAADNKKPTANVFLAVSVPIDCKARVVLPQFEERAFLTSGMADDSTIGASITRAATVYTAATAGIVSVQNCGVFLQVTPCATGQSAVLWSSYVDGDNGTSIVATATQLIIRKRISGTNYDAVLSYTHTRLLKFQVQAIWTDAGTAIRARSWSESSWGAWTAWVDSTNSTAAQIGALYQLGGENGGSIFAGFYRYMAIDIIRKSETLDEYKQRFNIAISGI